MYGRTGANNPMFGKTHSTETRAKISAAQTGKSHTPETRAQIGIKANNWHRSGANHPMYGKVPTHAMTIYVYDLDNVLVRSFASKVAAFANT